ncbi:MAG TPA: CBS domain-containing protein, partial [Lacunisphaera sp.]
PLMNTTIATLLEQKDGAVFTIPSTVTVAEAVQEMNAHKVGSVLVMNGLRLAGIFTERDVLRRVVGADIDPRFTPITKVMTSDVLTIEPTATVQEVMDIFTNRRCRHLPVMADGRLLGVISIGDVSRWVANLHRVEAESLRQYIAGALST